MQKFNVYSIYDVKAETYGNLFICPNDALALRIFEQVAQFSGNPDHQRYPEDFALYCIGAFLDSSGVLSSDTPRLVCSMISVCKQSRGAAVGGDSPLKSQSANNEVSSADAESSFPACDAEETTFSKSEE